jgi:DNA end-binding protein Ku
MPPFHRTQGDQQGSTPFGIQIANRQRMRPLWKGTIGFGLVSIPVKLFSATQESELDLDMLDGKDKARIRFHRINEDTGKEVPYERIVRAFDLEGRYVVLEDADLKNAAVEKSDVITIHDFVQEEEVEGKYFEKPYYLEPDKGGTRAYALLREALRKSGKVGIASFVMRTKEHPAVLVPDGPVLILNQLRYAEEIRPISELKLPGTEKASPAELKLAMQLIDQGAGTFDITRYKDEYTSALMKVIRAKAKGKGPKVTPMKVVHKKPTEDLMSVLQASLGAKGSAKPRKKATSRPDKVRHRKAS